jgi:uncharacterized membrane protein YeaQ/YmgE (transglycosylase-associated protein family)
VLGTILAVLWSGFVIGALARWAVPGPDPMPIWLTVLFGLGGAMIGGALTVGMIGGTSNVGRGDYFAIVLASILTSSLLIILYRRYVQGRPITGPEAHKLPTKGIGIGAVRQRLQRMGVDPDSIGSPGGPARLQPDETQENLRKLDDLHRAGLLTDEEHAEKRRKLLEG